MIENITNTFLTAKKINDERTNHIAREIQKETTKQTKLSNYRKAYQHLQSFGAPESTVLKSVYITKNINDKWNGIFNETEIVEMSESILYHLTGNEGEEDFKKEILGE